MHMADNAYKYSVFEAVYEKITAKWEGGLDDDPADSGGITNYGVSITFLSDLYASSRHRVFLETIGIKNRITRETIKGLTKAQAKAIFEYRFWDEAKAYLLPDPVAAVFFDTAVNCGIGGASKILQKAVGVKQDGIVGTQTRAAIAEKGALVAAHLFLAARGQYYEAIVKNKPSQKRFLRGWMNRVNDLKVFLTHQYGEILA